MHKLQRSTGIIISLLFYSFLSVQGQSPGPESIDLVEEDGFWFFKHQVSKGETLYSLSRMYRVSVNELESINPDASKGLEIDKILLIPVDEEFRKIHVVKKGETLYTIARIYNTKVSELKMWNSLKGNSIDIGQQLQVFIFYNRVIPQESSGENVHLVVAGESLYGIAKEYNVSVSNLLEWNNLESNSISTGQKLIVSENQVSGSNEAGIQASGTKENSVKKSEDNEKRTVDNAVVTPILLESPFDRFERIEERGMAELIDGSTESVKYLALHRNAPKGTILKVRNELYNQVVFVRVIGPLPDTGMNDRVIVKISKAAWEKLGAVNKRFRVKVSYFQ